MTLVPQLIALALVVTLAAPACSKPPAEARPEPAAPVEPIAVAQAPTPVPVAAPPDPALMAAAPTDFPAECVAYAALIEKLKACDEVGEGREGLMRGYDELRATWPTLAADQRGAFDAQCKLQADSLRDAAAATCAW